MMETTMAGDEASFKTRRYFGGPRRTAICFRGEGATAKLCKAVDTHIVPCGGVDVCSSHKDWRGIKAG